MKSPTMVAFPMFRARSTCFFPPRVRTASSTAPGGLHHGEVWAHDISDGTRLQILPEKLQTRKTRVKPWIGTDGEVCFTLGDQA